MGFLDWLSGATPGQQVGQAGAEVIKGVFGSIGNLIEEFHLPPEKAQEFKLRLQELQLQATQAQLLDVQSARQMQMATRSPWPGILTALNTLGFFAVVGIIIAFGLPRVGQTGTEALLLLLGALTTGYLSCLSFWVGKNSGTDETRTMLYNSVPATSKPPVP
jgi:hypothetical protein